MADLELPDGMVLLSDETTPLILAPGDDRYVIEQATDDTQQEVAHG